uniref:Tc1-like transposase DDE domain-containing protein n=1 Tax=Lepeophtheirus salmonis TaxID=72036 RepID=A0A0K2TWC8_LEPSM
MTRPNVICHIYVQDGEPAYTSGMTQDWLAAHMPFWNKNIWPPQSPVLNPLDYSVWWQIEKKACATRHPNLDSLKASVNEQWPVMEDHYIINV